MTSAFPRSPKLEKGSLIAFEDTGVAPEPLVIPFQYNPETLNRTFTVWEPEDDETRPDRRSQPYDPAETFELSLIFDATDALEQGTDDVALQHGVGAQLAALETLLYPSGPSRSELVADAAASLLGAAPPATSSRVRVILLSWGPTRVLPVRLTDFSIEEARYAPNLAPIRAVVSLTIRVLIPSDFPAQPSPAERLAVSAYRFTQKQKDELAASLDAPIGDSVRRALGL